MDGKYIPWFVNLRSSGQLYQRRSEHLRSSNRILSRIIRLTVETNSLTGKAPPLHSLSPISLTILAGVAILSLIIFFGAPQYPTLVVPPYVS